MQDIEHARHLVSMARKDLKPLPHLLEPETADTEFFGFHVQQATEKALKAWLSLIGEDYPKTHDLARLFKQIENSGQDVPQPFLDLIDLTSFAVQYRYEWFDSSVGEIDRVAVVRQVSELVEHIENLLRQAESS